MSKRGLDLAFGNLGVPKHPVRTLTRGPGQLLRSSLSDSAMMSARLRIPKP
jgi:hypothetical protein